MEKRVNCMMMIVVVVVVVEVILIWKFVEESVEIGMVVVAVLADASHSTALEAGYMDISMPLEYLPQPDLTKHYIMEFEFIVEFEYFLTLQTQISATVLCLVELSWRVQMDCEILWHMRSEVDGFVYVSHDGKQS